ncbi:hypothetical protein K439DRAFT_1636896 [Ramaria rubella]|nr:hypothetical protein K439DRAFT_1636896 [Ramaria rubella]
MDPLSGEKWGHVGNLFALIIGIDNYHGAATLTGAVPDANKVDRYIRQHLGVSEDRITNLRDEEATRQKILEAFRALSDPSNKIRKQNPILIYFAGHGCEITRPDGWDTGGQETIQAILAQDVQLKEWSSRTVFPIPDRTIASYLNKLSKEKGNNTTVIFDCCHAAHGTRGEGVRSEKFYGQLPSDIDSMSGIRSQVVLQGFEIQNLRSHVLLAACGAREFAREGGGKGFFTEALLNTFEKSGVDKLSYVEFMKQLPELSHQNPQCEGHHQGRILFSTHIPRMGFDFFPVVPYGTGYRVSAGKVHGVDNGSLFDVYSKPAIESDVNKRLCSLRVEGVDVLHAIAISESETSTLSGPAFAHHIPGKTLNVYFSDMLLDRVFLLDILHNAKNIVSAEKRDADFIVDLDTAKDEAVIFLNIESLTKHGYKRLPRGVPARALAIANVLLFASRWKLQLDNCSPDQWGSNVHLEFIRLETSNEVDDGGFYMIKRKDEENLNHGNVVNIVVNSEDFYGIRLRNETKLDLYPYLFSFDASDLSITCHYQSGTGAGLTAVSDAPLPKSNGLSAQSLTIGYGAGGGIPISYKLEEGVTLDITILKLYHQQTDRLWMA